MSNASGLGTSDLRETNRKIVLRSIWRDQPISRADVARLTRINKSSVSSIVNGLLAEGLIREEPAETTQIGRTPILITINSEKHHFIALDVRESGATVALYDLGGHAVADIELPPPGHSAPAKFLLTAAEEAAALCKRKRISLRAIRALGAAFPGQVSREEGLVISSPGIRWNNVSADKLLREKLGKDLDIYIENSANQALRAELWRGHSVPENLSGVYVDINESIETGIILDGKILGGRKFGNNAFGRMRILFNGFDAREAFRTWEELISLRTLVKRFRGARGSKSEKPQDLPSALLELRDAYLKGDPEAKSLLAEEARWLAVGLSNIIVSLGLPTIVVGGYIRSVWDIIQEQVFRECETLTEHEFPATHEIRLSSLSSRESLEGAALSAIGQVIPLDILSLLTNEHKALLESRILIF